MFLHLLSMFVHFKVLVFFVVFRFQGFGQPQEGFGEFQGSGGGQPSSIAQVANSTSLMSGLVELGSLTTNSSKSAPPTSATNNKSSTDSFVGLGGFNTVPAGAGMDLSPTTYF
jgi:hypothetical protein